MWEESQEYSAMTEGHTAQPSSRRLTVIKEGFLEYLWLSWILAEEVKQSGKTGVGLVCLGGRDEF